MSKHTPGPWMASGFANLALVYPVQSARIIWSPSESKDVAYVAPAASPADKALLASAPELLEALEHAAEKHRCGCGHPHCGSCEDYCYYAEVIRKAKGEV